MEVNIKKAKLNFRKDRNITLKILVDELPKRPIDCPYSKIVTEKDNHCWWSFCSKGGFVCKDTKQCGFLKPITEYKVDVYNSPVYGVITE